RAGSCDRRGRSGTLDYWITSSARCCNAGGRARKRAVVDHVNCIGAACPDRYAASTSTTQMCRLLYAPPCDFSCSADRSSKTPFQVITRERDDGTCLISTRPIGVCAALDFEEDGL